MVSGQWSVVSCQLSVVSCQWSVVSCHSPTPPLSLSPTLASPTLPLPF
ncbi:hypothetical protein [Argonema antarcticum]|nr:hypothetical protein [Argonema antarcticum]MCL1474019.1 hypothetical protein [Argonema antarcticum A004/B2]